MPAPTHKLAVFCCSHKHACATFRSILNMQSGCVQKLIMHLLNACMSASCCFAFAFERLFCAVCCEVQGWSGLHKELAVDMQRLWQRNLGRDDRLVADTSRCFLSLPDSLAEFTMSTNTLIVSCHTASSWISPASLSLLFNSILTRTRIS